LIPEGKVQGRSPAGEGFLKAITRVNQAPVKVFCIGLWQSSVGRIAILVIKPNRGTHAAPEIRQLFDGAINANNDRAQTGVDAALMTTGWSRWIGRQLHWGSSRRLGMSPRRPIKDPRNSRRPVK
jgi:hypothetical protein